MKTILILLAGLLSTLPCRIAMEGPQPHTILVAPGGKVVFRHNGEIGEEELLDKVLEVMSNAYQPTP
ncbi:MAG TPA: hypothetical protein PLR25_20600 [Planctomycetaceae bacterium]|nr:hypothetical protein [Planctomycetaceae bacterium]